MMTVLTRTSRNNEKLWENKEFEELERVGQIAQVSTESLSLVHTQFRTHTLNKSMAWQCMLIIFLLEAVMCRSWGLSDQPASPARQVSSQGESWTRTRRQYSRNGIYCSLLAHEHTCKCTHMSMHIYEHTHEFR